MLKLVALLDTQREAKLMVSVGRRQHVALHDKHIDDMRRLRKSFIMIKPRERYRR